ncbi:DUF1214 domain-containing protein, partial [Rhizobium sp. Root268]
APAENMRGTVETWVNSQWKYLAAPGQLSVEINNIVFSPDQPKEKSNWIQTVPGKGWFPIFRFYGPSEPYFDKTWKLEDIKATK